MKWLTKLFQADVTPATDQDKALFIASLRTCELFYRTFERIPEYKQYADTLKEISEDSNFIQELTHQNAEKLIRLLQKAPFGIMSYPGAEKLAFQYCLRKE